MYSLRITEHAFNYCIFFQMYNVEIPVRLRLEMDDIMELGSEG